MQTTVFGEILGEAFTAFKVEELLQLLGPFVTKGTNVATQGHRQKLPQLIFEAREGYVLLKQDPVKSVVLKKLGFDALFEPGRMARLLTILNTTVDSHSVWNNADNFGPFLSFHDGLATLRTFKRAIDELIIAPGKAGVTKDEATLSLEVTDYDNQGIEPDRLVSVIRAAKKLHDTVSQVMEVPSTMRVVHLDSGSNSIITVKGDGKVIEQIRVFLRELWNIIRFRKLDDFDRRLESLDRGLSMIEKIEERVRSGALDAGTAELLKHRLKAEALTLIGKSSLPREVYVDATVDTRQLLLEKRDLKLIQSGEERGDAPEAVKANIEPSPNSG